MQKNSTGSVNRRNVLRAATMATSIPALTAFASEGVAADTSISFFLYPGNDDDMKDYVIEARDEMQDHFAPQLDEVGVDLGVYDQPQVPDHVDELMGDYYGTFEYYVKEEIHYTSTNGSRLHMWFNTESTGGANTPGGSLVDGNGDAFTDMSMNSYQYDSFSFRRNMYFHEALHALMEEGQYGFTCGSHSANDDEHTCGEIIRYSGSTYDYLQVSPMATSYDDYPSEMGDACNELPDNYPDDRYYTYDFSSCTMNTLDNFFTYNDL